MISKSILYLAVILVMLAYFLSKRVQPGLCPQIKTMEKFEPQKYMGKWFEIQKYPMIWQSYQKCTSATYSLNPNGSVTVNNEALFKFIDYPVGIVGLATTPRAADTSKLVVQFGYFGKGDYWVIDTDYTSYSLVYTCRQLPVPSQLNFPLKLEYSWILSRKPTLAETRVKALEKVLSAKSDIKQFFKTDQTNCPKN